MSVDPTPFQLTVKDLRTLIEAEKATGLQMLQEHGGPAGLAEKLSIDPSFGIDSTNHADLKRREVHYGRNIMPTKAQTSFFQLVWDALHDFTLIMLMVSSVVSLGLGIWEDIEGHGPAWVEGVAILFSVVLVVLVSAGNDYAKERQFRKLNAQAEDVPVNVIRNGKQQVVSIFDLYVGDIVEITVGDILPADGILLKSSDLKIDESSLTGESDMIKKGPERPFLLSNTKAMEGSGAMLVIAVGQNSQAGIIKQLIITGKFQATESEDKKEEKKEESEEGGSVLQEKLEKLAIFIGKIGTVVAVLAVVIMSIEFLVEYADEWKTTYWSDLVRFLITGITILVVAVPEGLPLAVTLSLAFSVQRMLEDKNLVKHLDACETMGSATTICSDKTGTLTTNRMTVMAAWIGDIQMPENPSLSGISSEYRSIFSESISCNSTGRIEKDSKGLWDYIGNKTECGLLRFLVDCNVDYDTVRKNAKVIHTYPFSSKRKRMTTVVRLSNDQVRLYTKGASEIILGLCTHYRSSSDQIESLTESKKAYILSNVIESYASQGLRTLCIAYRDISLGSTESRGGSSILDERDVDGEPVVECNFVCLGIMGIEDPVRPEVPGAIDVCRGAGITVRMVTGDNYTTAISIARKCGILQANQGITDTIAMEGPVFRKRVLREDGTIDQDEFDRIWPNLRVLARSSPADKFTLVTGLLNSKLEKNRQVVAVTGDGTNDAPALKKADVGFAMGIQGTSVAKDACDIILLDDNFTSIVKAVKWGRNVYDSIGKFLQFQLIVNIVAITVAFFGSVIKGESPLKAVQLLWVNLIMDSFASLALATEPPTDDLLKRKPYGRNKPIISPRMAINILGQSLYQLIVMFILTFSPESFDLENGFGHTDAKEGPTAHLTVVFNTFVLMQLFNELNARNLHGEANPLRNILSNKIFIYIWVGTMAVQVLIVLVGGRVFYCKPLNGQQWSIGIGLGLLAMIWGVVIQFIPESFIVRLIPSLGEDGDAVESHPKPQGRSVPLEVIVASQDTPPNNVPKQNTIVVKPVVKRGSSRLMYGLCILISPHSTFRA
eukprot:TRINITY_DN1790_c0_g1_i3.p1 TRINITY_DN1790_c0_g1~~TRINITY_DN1790_c0_g1_i3.p1  ORF type:complete len:1061 (-),score=214.77 TRINITY_DN1790_c0_g1_i3:197-3379(-)